MAGSFNKEIVRSITQSAGRFAAIAIISLLGAGFYAGLRMAAPDMRIAGDAFFDGANLYDVSVMTTLGVDDDSLKTLGDVEGVGAVMPAYRADAMVLVGESGYAAVIESLPVEAARESDTSDGETARSDDERYLNRPLLKEGEWPSHSDECVVGIDAAEELGVSIGDTVKVEKATTELEDTFAQTSFKVTGLVNSPAYASTGQLGITTLGTGMVELYLYVPEGAFAEDFPYSVAYLTVPAADGEHWGTEEYDNAVAGVKENVDTVADELGERRWETVVADAQAELDDARAEYEEERADAESELADAASKLADAKNELDDADSQLGSSQDKLFSAYDELSASYDKLMETREQLDEAAATLEQTNGQLAALKQLIDAGQADERTIAQYEQGLAAYEQGLAEYQQGEKAYAEGLAAYEKGLAEYESGRAEYEQGIKKFSDGQAEYADGLSEYEDGRAEADEKFADAEAELADAQAEIDDIERPEVYVTNRDKNYGAAQLASDADGIAQIALFLPFMFFLVAALVSLTSMTRMVDEERMVIGTHKALGYSRARITSKYLIYGVLASGIGSVIGVFFFGWLLPWIIMTSYQVTYAVPTVPTPIDPGIAARAIGLSVGITAIATWTAAAASLREKPAALMLPRVPKAGKRIFLEHITPLWERLSFSHKVTARNLLRYKRRFFMAVIGIAGCTALLVIGFGLRDVIGSIVSSQFGELVNYDVAVRVDEDASDEARAQVDEVLASAAVEAHLDVKDFNMVAAGPNGDMRIEVVVPEDAADLPDFVTLRNRVDGQPLSLEGDSVVLTEKAATELGLSVGDEVVLFDENDVGDATGEGRNFTVGGITENYLGHYAYMQPSGYRAAFDEEPVSDLTFVKLASDADSAAFSDELLSIDGVNTVSFVSEKIATYQDMLDLMGKIILLIIALSAALAFVVLYNLTNINIAERVREIATLKVLGFTRSEVNAYIFREIIVMAIIGALIGCVIGMPLTLYIAQAAETPQMMFGRTIEPISYVLSFVITMVFAAFVAFTMRGKLAKVNMVESLKSVE